MRHPSFSLFILLLFAAGGLLGQAKTLHVIYNINDHQQDGIFQGCQQDRTNSEELFSTIGQLAREMDMGIQVKEHPVQFNKASITDFLTNLDPGMDDAIVFLFSGHGMISDNRSRWPLMYYCQEAEFENFNAENCTLSLKWVHDQLKAMNIRMSMAISSSCNNDPFTDGNVEQLRREMREHSSGTTEGGEGHYNFDLFTQFNGHILASGASPGEVAYLNDDLGSYYINAFLNVMIDGLISDKATTWASIFKKTNTTVNNIKPDQKPQFLIFRDNRNSYSGELTGKYDDDDAELFGFDEADFSKEWETAFEIEEALEMLPYILVKALIDQVSMEDTENFDFQAERIIAFYDQEVLTPYYFDYAAEDGLAQYYCEETVLSIQDKYFNEDFELAMELFPLLPEALRRRVAAFVDTLR
ncbi:caspase family protein [Lewinella sp. W8]|uniref:caspase family protein n=1 Tax=Lewinella sp. W8 TaxID=2528208 RepID=UPI00106837D9|nr:caspase family protein [Lewinella sp. W8]MTB52793.1 hypothetical protein [Lewinella sp. W8]